MLLWVFNWSLWLLSRWSTWTRSAHWILAVLFYRLVEHCGPRWTTELLKLSCEQDRGSYLGKGLEMFLGRQACPGVLNEGRGELRQVCFLLFNLLTASSQLRTAFFWLAGKFLAVTSRIRALHLCIHSSVTWGRGVSFPVGLVNYNFEQFLFN